MKSRTKRWLWVGGAAALVCLVTLMAISRILVARSEPYIREQAIRYLSERFDCDVDLDALSVRTPNFSYFKLLGTRGRGLIAHVEGDGIAMRLHGRTRDVPLFKIKKFSFDVDLSTFLGDTKTVPLVTIDGMQINIPPKGQGPSVENATGNVGNTALVIEHAIINDTELNIISDDPAAPPVTFEIHNLRLHSVGKNSAMGYEASLTNAKPPGQIVSQGKFGPWVASEPGDTPLSGNYTFENADLGVFDGIAGTLASSGRFEGTLNRVDVHGQASVPNFRLKISGNPVPLKTQFEVLVDGTDGDTILKPVVARLGSTDFKTSGAVIKEHGREQRTIDLDVSMPDGQVADLLRLAMKGEPMMEGRVRLQTKIRLPPLNRTVKEKLQLVGRFSLTDSRFLRSTIQDKINALSHRARGQPDDETVEQIVAGMSGEFRLENQIITFRSLQFAVPGAAFSLAGSYRLQGPIDFHGTMQLQAKISQTMSGWKHWLLKPIDPFFSKNGAGTFMRIKITGTADDPQYGLDRGR